MYVTVCVRVKICVFVHHRALCGCGFKCMCVCNRVCAC